MERKWKREEDKGDNEGRETQIGQNNILVGRFANMEQTYFASRAQTGLYLLLIISSKKERRKKTTAGNQNQGHPTRI